MKTPFLSLALALLVAAALPPVGSAAAESPSALLQKGIYAEEIERNLDSAIKIYEQIAAESATSRSVVAQAQYRLAVCYQKKGNKEQAISAFNDVLKQFPTDVALGQKAREALAQLGQTPSEDLKIRRVATLDGTPLGVTPDGRFTIYRPSARPMDRSIYEIATGKIWATLKGDSENTVRGVFFSPDGRRTSYRYAGVIYVVGIDGSDPKPVYRMDKDTRAMPMGWADDRTMWVDWWSGEKWTYGTTRFVGKLDIETGMLKEIARLPAHENEGRGVGLSPDGRYATLFAKPNPTGPAQLWTLELDSGRVHTLVEKEVSGLEGWFGTNLVFTRELDRAQELWMIGVKDGRPAGAPKLVKSDLGTADLCGVTHDGSLYYAERASRYDPADLWIMEGFLAKAAAEKSPKFPPIWAKIPVEPLRKSDNEIVDPKFGLSAMMPPGWSIKDAIQLLSSYAGARTILLSVPKVSTAEVTLMYRPRMETDFAAVVGSTPPSSDEIAARLDKIALRRWAPGAKNRPNFHLRPGTVSARPIDDDWVFSGVADYTDYAGRAWVLCICSHYSTANHLSAELRVPADDFDTAFSEFKQLTETIRLR